ncbi:MAG: hypothetical protein FWB73_06245 [Treponema sp.]|nr:hypothetical protein [Treponema sp.]
MIRKIFVILFLFASVLMFAGGNKEKDVEKVQVTGVVRLVGPSLFSEIVISGMEYMWYIVKEEKNKLHDLQHRTVTVEGVESVRELKFANGRSAGIRRELRNIKIINIE